MLKTGALLVVASSSVLDEMGFLRVTKQMTRQKPDTGSRSSWHHPCTSPSRKCLSKGQTELISEGKHSVLYSCLGVHTSVFCTYLAGQQTPRAAAGQPGPLLFSPRATGREG